MSHAPHLDTVNELLSRVLRRLEALEGIREGEADAPQGYREFKNQIASMRDKRNRLFTAVPALSDLQNWVEIHWDPERQTQPPADTVSTGDKWGNQGEAQLDALSATFKLILAAWGHGAETVAQYATEFAAHGMIEVRSIFLLKGVDLQEAQSLDNYCTLLPYRQALERVTTASPFPRYSVEDLEWPPATVGGVCALESRGFERRGTVANEFERRASRLLRCGPETLALMLDLVCGHGLRPFGSWHFVPNPLAATLPFFYTTAMGGSGSARVMLPVQGWKGPNATSRPLAIKEVAELMDSYAMLPAQSRTRLDLTLRRLRDSGERSMVEDRAIDVCIALEALFMEKDEGWNQKKLISRRGSWYFADSIPEREQTRDMIKAFYDRRSDIVHGNAPEDLTPAEEDQRRMELVALLTDIDDVARASLKTMISEGRPLDWDDSKDFQSIRHNPPREDTQIPSVKSDSLSWSRKDQQEIDRALETVWKPTVKNAPVPNPDASPTCHRGVDREQIERFRQQGVYYIIRIPALLYMAHPKWLERAHEPLDAHTRYYCERDVKRHMERWQRAASEKRVYQFDLELEDATMYLPKYFVCWRELLSEEPKRAE